MRVVLTTGARSDLRGIALHIAKDDPSRARSFVAELREVAGRLGDMPRAFPLVPRYERHGIRRRSYRGYGSSTPPRATGSWCIASLAQARTMIER